METQNKYFVLGFVFRVKSPTSKCLGLEQGTVAL